MRLQVPTGELGDLLAAFRPMQHAGGTEERNRRTLKWLLRSYLILLALTSALLLTVRPDASQVRAVALVLLPMILLNSIAYWLNTRSLHYEAAAWITILTSAAAPWFSAILNPAVLHENLASMVGTAISIMLSGMLLSPRSTVLVGAAQVAALQYLFMRDPAASASWYSLLTIVLFISVLSVVSSTRQRRDIDRIEGQAREILERERAFRELAVRDGQTHLFNYRYLEEGLAREVAASQRSGEPVGVIVFDIDHFKLVNDACGHREGDDLLRAIAELVLRNIRASDFACRWGGDEFVIVMPGATVEIATERAEHLREEVRRLSLLHTEGVARLSISAGVAIYDEHGTTPDALLDAADRALYRAKAEGRDRVLVAESRDEEEAEVAAG